MKVADIDYQKRRILVMGKGSKERAVVFGPGAADALKTYLNGRETGYVFEEGTPLQRGCITTCRNKWLGVFTVYGKQPGYSRKVEYTLGSTFKINYDEAYAIFKRRTKRLNLIRPRKTRALGCDAMRRIINVLALRGRVPHATPHMLRHSFATHMFDHGAGICEVRELLGHKSILNTEVYLRISKKVALETFDKYHPAGAGANNENKAQETQD